MSPPVITFLSDYGLSDDFVGVCHGVIAGICPEARVIDLTHGVPRGDIRAGALVLRGALPYVPVGVHLAVVDPGVGGDRRAVALRDQGCAWPRCRRPAAVCDVHHLVHKKDGGKTAVSSCVLLCQFHHDVCIHRWGWQLILHPDGTTEARGPDGQILRSHGPPTLRAG